jgi:hydroxypyruvate reductase
VDAERLTRHAEVIFRAALSAVRPDTLVRRMLRVQGDRLRVGELPYTLGAGRVLVAGGGKASGAMAAALEGVLDDRIDVGVVAVKDGHTVPTSRVRLREAGHPVPDARGVAAAEAMISLAHSAREGDLLIVLLSGGGSALLTLPTEGITLEDKRRVTDHLLRAGAAIGDLNAVRKHLSRIKGGRLAQAVPAGRVLTLILSDVVGDRLDVIASGPTSPDPTTWSAAMAVLDRFDPARTLPENVRRVIRDGLEGHRPETPKPGAPGFGHVQNVILGHNVDALSAARDVAESLGFHTRILSPDIEGEAREVAADHARTAREIREKGTPLALPACILSGGETTVTVRGNGKGGRNTESALAFAIAAEGLPGAAGLFAGTDGTDGPTDAAGAIADGGTVARARAQGLDPRAFLENNDSYTFFDRAGGLLRTGPTLTNVMDLRIVLVG